MRMRKDPKKYINQALNTIGKMPEQAKREVKTQKELARKPVSIKGSDRDPRHTQITNFCQPEEEPEIDNESFNQQKALYG